MSNKTQYKQSTIGKIPEDWKVWEFKSLTENYDSLRVPLSKMERQTRKGAYPYFGASGVIDYVDDYIYDGKFLLISEDGENLRSRKQPINFIVDGKFWVNNHAHIIKSNENSYLEFLHYWFLSNSIASYLSGSVQPKLSQENLNKIKILCPSVLKQQQIASILSSLDDKIELNRKMNKTLEEIGKALFKRWFVDFEFPCLLAYGERTQAIRPELMQYGYKSFGGLPAPEPGKFFVYVLELENGHRYIGMTDFILKRYHEHVTEVGAKYTLQHKPVNIIHWEKLASKQEAAVREQWLKTGFGRKWLDREEKANRLRQAGGKMVDLSAHAMQAGSELREIPEGWEAKKIGDLDITVTDFVANGSFASLKKNTSIKDQPDYALFLRNTDLKANFASGYKYVDKHSYEFLAKTKLYGGEVIISNVGDVGSVYRCPFFEKPMTLGNNQIVIKAKEKNLFFYLLFKSVLGKSLIDSITSGSVQNKFNKTDFRNLQMVWPQDNVLQLFLSIIKPLYEKIETNSKELKNIISLRDSLLPRLMSGKLRVKDYENN